MKQAKHKNLPLIWNGKADGEPGSGISFAIVGDHENRPTGMTNLVVITIEQRVKKQAENTANT